MAKKTTPKPEAAVADAAFLEAEVREYDAEAFAQQVAAFEATRKLVLKRQRILTALGDIATGEAAIPWLERRAAKKRAELADIDARLKPLLEAAR